MSFAPVAYDQLNARQKEIYNFQKIAARMADYGFNCIWLSDDWQGADFLAVHLDGKTVLRVQLKARMVLDRKYIGKGIQIAFRRDQAFFVYPHDDLLAHVQALGVMDETGATWAVKGFRHWPVPPVWAQEFLEAYRI